MSEPSQTDIQRAFIDAYRIERHLGQGGMATVYLAEDLKHHRKVALKILRPDLAAVVAPDRFRREIGIAARLQHPHILTVFDSGNTGGMLWYTMPFVEGESLRDRLDRERELPVDQALQIIREVADALDYAHTQGIVHRDIKPENILLSRGHALVADFGIARALHEESSRLTATGMAIGTPAYMSPEQATADRDVDPRSDIYSLGSVAFETLTGEPPYTGATARAIMVKRITDPVPSPRRLRAAIPAGADRAIMRSLAPTPADRPATAGEFARDLMATSPAPTTRRSLVRNVVLAIGVIAVVAVTFALVRRPAAAPPAVAGHLERGNLLLARRTPAASAEAIREFQATLALQPRNAAALAGLGFSYAMFAEWGWPYEKLGPADLKARAIDYSGQAIGVDSNSAAAWLTRGYALVIDDPYRMRGAVEAFTRSLAIDSTSAEGWYQVGQAHMALGRSALAAAAYRRSFALDPNRPLTFMSLAAMSLQEGRIAEAKRIIDSAVAASRTVASPYVRVLRGLISLAQGNVREAHDDADLALAMDSTYTIPARSLLAEALVLEGNRRGAGEEVALALKELGSETPSPTNARFIASALIALQRREEAITLIERVRPRGAYLWFYLHAAMFKPLHADPRFEKIYRDADPGVPRDRFRQYTGQDSSTPFIR